MRPPVVPAKSNDPAGARPTGPGSATQAPRALSAELRDLDALLEVLRDRGVASYHRRANGTVTILLFASPPRPSSGAEEIDGEEKRAESLDRWDRKIKFGASGGMRGP